MLRLLALVGKGGRGGQGMARPEENVVSMRMERNQFLYSRFTFSYQSFLFKQIAFSYEKEVVPAVGGRKRDLSLFFSLKHLLFPAFGSESHLGLRNTI